MKRFLSENLLDWKNSDIRKPLILRGARQVGKSYIVNELGKKFDHFVEINFEMEPSLSQIFAGSLDPRIVIEKIAIAKEVTVIPGKTLLFLDEIQTSPNALTALRYFYEKMPELHVIATGSLLEFVLEKTGMPVGRVSSMYLYPLSFKEFLIACGKEKLCDYIDRHDIETPLEDIFLEQVMTSFAEYMAVGGMPEAVNRWVEERDMKKVRKIHGDILETYRYDFLKYVKSRQIHYVERVFSAVPRMLGNKFIYSRVDDTLKGREIKPAIELLEMAQVIHRVRHASANGVPLEGQCNDSLFKTIFLDVGLAQALLGLNDGDWMLDWKKSMANKGSIIEAFAGQEFLAYSNPHAKKKLFYWVREKANAMAEVDYVIEKENQIIPVEIKSGASGSLKSLLQFLKEKPGAPYGIHLSPLNSGKQNQILRVPLGAIWRIFDG